MSTRHLIGEGSHRFRRNSFYFRDGAVVLVLTSQRGEPVAETTISTSDFERVSDQGRWHLGMSCCRSRNSFRHYSVAVQHKAGLLHRFVMSAPNGFDVDHINGNTLDNRRENLRIVTKSQNAQNAGAHRDSSSGVRNVYKAGSRWTVQICLNRKRVCFGEFDTVEEAAVVAEQARRQYHSHSPENSGVAL